MGAFPPPPRPQMPPPPLPLPLPLGKLPPKLTDSILPYLCVKCCAMSEMCLARDIASTPYVPPMHPPSAIVAVVAVHPRFQFVFHMVPRMLKLHPYC